MGIENRIRRIEDRLETEKGPGLRVPLRDGTILEAPESGGTGP